MPRPDGTAPERAPLLAAARAFLLDRPSARRPTVSAIVAGWPRAAGAADAERLAPVLYALGRAAGEPVPGLERLRPAWIARRRQHLLGVVELRRLLCALAERSIPVIPLKGPALAETLYDDPGLRPFTDLDLLVRRPDMPRALDTLGALGYRHLGAGRSLAYELAHASAACFAPASAGPFELPVDLHWELVGFPGGVTPCALATDEVWSRAGRRERWGLPVLELEPEDLLLYLALHLAVHHPLDGLVWRLDLALLIRRQPALDWEAVAGRARRLAVAGAVYFALCSVEGELGAGVPPAVLAGLRPRGVRRILLERLSRHRDGHGRLDHVADLLMLDRVADRIRALRVAVAPSPGWVRRRYGARGVVRGYAAHYRRLLAIPAALLGGGGPPPTGAAPRPSSPGSSASSDRPCAG